MFWQTALVHTYNYYDAGVCHHYYFTILSDIIIIVYI